MNLDLFELSKDEQLNFLGYKDVKKLEVYLDKVKKSLENQSLSTKWWDLIHRETGETMGNCGFHNWSEHHERAELGYALHEDFRGEKIMTEAVLKVLAFGFNEMKLNRIEALVGTDNIPSIKIIENAGFKKEGLLRSHYKENNVITDSLIYSLLKTEYE